MGFKKSYELSKIYVKLWVKTQSSFSGRKIDNFQQNLKKNHAGSLAGGLRPDHGKNAALVSVVGMSSALGLSSWGP